MIRFAPVLLLAFSACTRSHQEEVAPASALASASPSASSKDPASEDSGLPAAPAVPAAPSSASLGAVKSEPPDPSVTALCDKICSRSRVLACPGQAKCLSGCIEMAGIPGCAAPFKRLYACLAAEPIAHWECGEDGVPAIRDGFCEKEQATAVNCAVGRSNR